MPTPFAHLHNHSEFSLLDGASKIKDMVKYAVDNEMPAIALTRRIGLVREESAPYQRGRYYERFQYDAETGQPILCRCPGCGQYKPLEEHVKNRRAKHGIGSYCKACYSAWARQYVRTPRGKDARRKAEVKHQYGIDGDELQRMKDEQRNRCKICGDLPRDGYELCVDHCHTTGRVRGLLCDPCNRVLSYMKEDPELLRQAAIYLEKSKGLR